MYWPEYAGGESLQVSSDLLVDLYCITENETHFQRELYLYKLGIPKRKVTIFKNIKFKKIIN